MSVKWNRVNDRLFPPMRAPGVDLLRWMEALAVYNKVHGKSISFGRLIFLLLDEFADDVEDTLGEGRMDEFIKGV